MRSDKEIICMCKSNTNTQIIHKPQFVQIVGYMDHYHNKTCPIFSLSIMKVELKINILATPAYQKIYIY